MEFSCTATGIAGQIESDMKAPQTLKIAFLLCAAMLQATTGGAQLATNVTVTNLQGRVFRDITLDHTNKLGVIWMGADGSMGQFKYTDLAMEFWNKLNLSNSAQKYIEATALQQEQERQAKIAHDATLRTWTLQSGATVAGDYISSDTTMVVIRRDGTNYFLKIPELSTNDQAYAARMQSAQREARLDAAAEQEQIARDHQAALDAITGIYKPDVAVKSWSKIDLRSDGSAMVFLGSSERGQSGAWTFASKSVSVSSRNRQETFTVEGDDLIDSKAHRWLHIR